MAQYVPINQATDVITDTTKVTTGYFTGGVGSLAKDSLTTASLSTTQKKYYYNLQHSSEDQFSVTFGHLAGSGSGACDETKAIYKQFMNLLLDPADLATGSKQGFIFDGVAPTSGSGHGFTNTAGDGPAGTAVFEDGMYFIVAERARMKDRLNKENWTLVLSGSRDATAGTGEAAISGSQLSLTDDSKTNSPTATPVGPRYNIITGSSGNVAANNSSSMFYGHYYPNVGIIALRQHMLSSSLTHGLNGTAPNISSSTFMADGEVGKGLTIEDSVDGTADNAIKLAAAIHMGAQTFRSEEDQTSKAYFCRALANDFNFSNNPTFVSGSNKALRNQDMVGYPHTFITTVGLYQTTGGTTIGGGGSQELVAVGRLSSPVQKNYGTEATIKVKLTY